MSAYDAIIVLGARIEWDGRCGASAERRVETAARLWKEKGARHVIMAGGRLWGPFMEAERMAQLAIELGVSSSCLVLEPLSLTTFDNARFCSSLVRGRRWNNIALVTCDWHMPRALRCFAHFGLFPTPIPAPSEKRILGSWLWDLGHEQVAQRLDGVRRRLGTLW